MPKIRTLVEALTDRESNARYHLAERVARRLHPEALLADWRKLWVSDTDLRDLWERLHGTSHYRGLERLQNLATFAAFVRDLPGDTAECGVYTGASSTVILQTLQEAGTREPWHHYGIDSFAGLSEPVPDDGSHWTVGDLAVGRNHAERNLAPFAGRFTLVEGWIPEVLEILPETGYRLVHVDVDLFEPTAASLSYFLDRVVDGGVVICDDYGFSTCPGAYRAVNEAVAARTDVRLLHLSSGQAVIVKG
jgi:O-methyltransferase